MFFKKNLIFQGTGTLDEVQKKLLSFISPEKLSKPRSLSFGDLVFALDSSKNEFCRAFVIKVKGSLIKEIH
jgi:hypothetical protein